MMVQKNHFNNYKLMFLLMNIEDLQQWLRKIFINGLSIDFYK